MVALFCKIRKKLKRAYVKQRCAILARIIRNKRDEIINNLSWRLERYERQFPLGETDDNDDWYVETLQYIQNLRDIPQQEGFPDEIVWPTL